MSETVAIDLDQAERHTLIHLLDNFIRERAWEAIQLARSSREIHKGAERGRLVADLHGLTEDGGGLAVADLDAHRANLVCWSMETESAIDEHEEMLVEADEDPGDRREIVKTIDELRTTIAVDYAHRCVCEKIVGQIDTVRGAVPA